MFSRRCRSVCEWACTLLLMLTGVSMHALASEPLSASDTVPATPDVFQRQWEAIHQMPAARTGGDINIALYVDSHTLSRYARGWNDNGQGEPLENGAQFLLARIQEQLSYAQEQLVSQGLPLRFNLSAIQTWVSHPDVSVHQDFNHIAWCFFAGQHEHAMCDRLRRVVGEAQYQSYFQASKNADVFLYWRDKRAADVVGGTAAPGVGLAVLDTYHEHLQPRLARSDPMLQVLLHEWGHVLGVNGHDPSACDSSPSVMRKKVYHPAVLAFFPDSDSESCRAWLIERQKTMRTSIMAIPNLRRFRAESDVALPASLIVRKVSDGTLTLSGSHTASSHNLGKSYVTWLAEDGTAKEGRHFWFGLPNWFVLPGDGQQDLVLSYDPIAGSGRTLTLKPVSQHGAWRYAPVCIQLPSNEKDVSVRSGPCQDGKHNQ